MVLTDLKKLKLIAIVLTISLIFTSLPRFLWTEKEVMAAETNVSITLPATVKCNEIFNGAAIIDQVDSLNACNYDIVFDSSLLEVLDVTRGNINAQDIPVDNWQEMEPGRIRIIQDLPGVDGLSGSGSLVNLTIRAKGLAGTTASVSLENGNISNANAEEILASWTGASTTIIDWASGLKICTETLPDAPADKLYSITLEAAGGISPYQWSIEGNLPPGLSLESETGIISGIPSASGNYSFTAVVNDSGGNVAKVILSISTGAVLDVNLAVPGSMRPFRNYLIDVQYANNSNYVMESPLLVVSSPSQAPLRFNTEQAFTTKPLQLLAINFHGQADQLPAHYSRTIQVETQATAFGPIDYSVGVVQADNTPINWEEVLNSISPFLEPSGRNAVIDNLKEQMGSTTADYIQTIRKNAGYLSRMDRYVYDVNPLLAMELRQAVAPYIKANLSEASDAAFNTPGIPLEFTRVYPQALDQRYYQGPLGWGWRHNYDISCVQLNGGSVLLRAPFYQGVFLLNSNGTFESSNSQYQLKKNNGLLELQTKTGTRYSFNANGLVSQITEQNGTHIDLIYNAGKLSEIVHSNGQKYNLQYNAQGLISALTDNFGKTSSYTYDGTGHLIQVKTPDGRQTSYTYNMEENSRALHSLVKTTYPDNSVKILSYDSRGRLAAEQLGNDAVPARIEYPETAVCLITDPTGAVTKFCLDENGQIIEKVDPAGEVSRLKYSPDGNPIKVSGPEGGTVGIEYDPEGNITGFIDPLGQRTSMIYKDNQLMSIEDPKLNKTSFSYDSMGNLEKIISPDGTWEAYLYDQEGKMTSGTDRKGQTESIQYDAKGQITRRDFSDGSWISYSYDASSNLTLVEDSHGKIQMQYNQRNLLTRITYPDGSFFNYSYDSAGRCIGRMDHSGYSLQYLYNSAGKLQTVKDGKGRTIVTYEYDTVGRMTKETKGNGVYTIYSYDIKGQLTSLQNFSSSGELLSKFKYAYDSTGRKISMTTLEGTTQYKYDARGMLTEVIYPDGRRDGYAYDAAGNRRAASKGSAASQYVTNNMNQYVAAGDTTYTYDANGNLISKISGGKTTTYQYDAQNRLIRMETAGDVWEYRYDALGNQTAVIHNGDERRFLADPVNDMGMAAEYDTEGTLVAQNIKGAGVAARLY